MVNKSSDLLTFIGYELELRQLARSEFPDQVHTTTNLDA